jgi:ribokinase
MTPAEIAVVGSLNLDFIVPVDHHPAPGETVLGGDHLQLPGGKGANQAVAAARLGRRVAIVGRVGADDPGRRLRENLAGEGVDVELLADDPDAPTGIALIAVRRGADRRPTDGEAVGDPAAGGGPPGGLAGENMIVVSPGANGRVSTDDVARAAGLLEAARVTLVQHEIPAEAVAATVHAAGGAVVLNPAPARAVDAAVLARVDVLVPNRTELALLSGSEVPESVGDAAALASGISGPRALVVTLGADGALVVDGPGLERIEAPAVEAVDSTGAGDAFCGALADALARGAELVEAARWAVRAAALSVTRPGAQGGLPSAADLA